MGFFAPESLLDDKGRRIMWAWAGDERDRETEHPACGWSGIFSIPCEMVMENGRIGLKPIEELQSITYGGDNRYVKLGPGDEVTVEGVANRSLDVCAWFMPKGAYRYGVKVCKSPHGDEETVIGICCAFWSTTLSWKPLPAGLRPCVAFIHPATTAFTSAIGLKGGTMNWT